MSIVLCERREHHGGNASGRIVGMKDLPGIGSAAEPVIVLSPQQNELALAAPRDLDRPPESGLDTSPDRLLRSVKENSATASLLIPTSWLICHFTLICRMPWGPPNQGFEPKYQSIIAPDQ
jgi:hypothetical protein